MTGLNDLKVEMVTETKTESFEYPSIVKNYLSSLYTWGSPSWGFVMGKFPGKVNFPRENIRVMFVSKSDNVVL